jgi:anti-sigma regulatory factor (Ser/Thr protein kinase)
VPAPRPTEVLLSLEPLPDAARVARHALEERGLHPELHHTVTLLTSEIVGNAVRHGGLSPGEKVVVHAVLEDDRIRVEVTDRGPGFDPEVRHDADGFGLRLMDQLATAWGVERGARSCRVWFEVRRGRSRFPRD